MKRRIAMFLALLMLLFTVAPAAFASSADGYRIYTPHEYAVKPGTDEWRSMDNVLNRRAACHVPEDELKLMSTKALVITVLEYPLLIDMYAYNSIEEGIEAVSMHFKGIEVLRGRKDALQYLKEYAAQEEKRTENTDIKYFYADTLTGYIAGKLSDLNASGEKATISPIYTPKRTMVPWYTYNSQGLLETNIFYNLTWTDHGTTALEQDIIAARFVVIYPSAVKKANPNPKYNCHSYAWHKQSDYINSYWINNPQVYLHDGSYSTSTVDVGRNAIYYNTIHGITHSGIVSHKGSGSTPTRINSKWGMNARFEHDVYDCPYYQYSGSNSVQYWKLNP